VSNQVSRMSTRFGVNSARIAASQARIGRVRNLPGASGGPGPSQGLVRGLTKAQRKGRAL
jgi:hypothetical protein